MGFCFSSPDKKDVLADSRDMINDNARVLYVCVEMSTGKLKEGIEKAYDDVRYMTPTTVVGAMQVDKKIGALAGDLKIALSKGSDRALAQADDIVKDLAAAIVERNSYNK
ncbi:MAG: hypothetical protein J1G04_04200 [Clostridiales bacterium]|nr:hypothetical protein [Clostridiales bacterium]